MYSLPCCKQFRTRRVCGAANLARVSFVHCPAVLTQEVLSKTLPTEFKEIMLQIAAPDVLLCCPPCSVTAERSLRKEAL